MSGSIQLDSDGNDITCMKEFDALKYPCRECVREDCKEREVYKNVFSNEPVKLDSSHRFIADILQFGLYKQYCADELKLSNRKL